MMRMEVLLRPGVLQSHDFATLEDGVDDLRVVVVALFDDPEGAPV